ncbi:MAG: hypothetical protein JSW11_01415 [Candidatus Heimdallarchaeota archaeon]|nr:MAG: hypothetical protein JSW11_01415 [Candidatus Heimdallarchaeota archaeon]
MTSPSKRSDTARTSKLALLLPPFVDWGGVNTISSWTTMLSIPGPGPPENMNTSVVVYVSS